MRDDDMLAVAVTEQRVTQVYDDDGIAAQLTKSSTLLVLVIIGKCLWIKYLCHLKRCRFLRLYANTICLFSSVSSSSLISWFESASYSVSMSNPSAFDHVFKRSTSQCSMYNDIDS